MKTTMTPSTARICFACGRAIPAYPRTLWAVTSDGQQVHVGPDCHRRVVVAGPIGYRPPKGGPMLYSTTQPAPTAGKE
jgi:hypothetical protein